MCWCWSDLPHHRPNFTQILEALRSESFTNLLATAEVLGSKSGHQITAACVNAVMAPKLKNAVQSDWHPSMSRLMSLVHGKSSRRGELAMQVIFGTEKGQCEVIQFQATGTTKKVHTIVLSQKL